MKAYWLSVSLPSGCALCHTKCQRIAQTLHKEYVFLSVAHTDPEADTVNTDNKKSLQLLNWVILFFPFDMLPK